MADPCNKAKSFPKSFQLYAEKHNLYDVFQELLKQMIIKKPEDTLAFVRDECTRVAKGMHNPQCFIAGSNVAQAVGKKVADSVGTKFLTLEEIIQSSEGSVKQQLEVFSNGDNGDETARKLLAVTVQQRLQSEDCESGGYTLFGFPQSKAQAICAQVAGLIPRQVFVFLPEPSHGENGEDGIGKHEGPQNTQTNYGIMKDITSVYHFDICKVISYEKFMKTKKSELESELQGILIMGKPSGAPFIPRVTVLGPPASGKSVIAEHLAEKFELINVDWIDLVRGAARWKDEVIVKEANAFLSELQPMSEESVKQILTTRLMKEDCEKKGWVFHGFPENKRHCELLEELFLSPNRIFLISCTQEMSASRMGKKKKVVMKRQLNEQKPGRVNDKGNFLIFPFGEKSVIKRFESFTKSMQGILEQYGSKIIFVDASMKPAEVKRFVETSVMHPPFIKNK